MKVKLNYQSFMMYFILIPFLHPTGFDEYEGIYKAFFTTYLYFAILIILIYFLWAIKRRMLFKKVIYAIILHYTLLAIITLSVQGKFSEGLQKLFAAPALCIICLIFLNINKKQFLQCIIHILMVIFSINIVLSIPLFYGLFEEVGPHWRFIGHVQRASQLGLLGMYVSIVTYREGFLKKSKRNFMVILSVLTMFFSYTAASLIALMIVMIGSIYCRYSRRTKIFLHDSKKYFEAYVIANMVGMFLLAKLNWRLPITWIALGLSGREFIWEAAFEGIKEKIWFGYGVYGYMIKVFWSAWTNNGIGMNYAHNDIVQKLLDGGIVLLIMFFIMICMYLNNVKRTNDKYLIQYTNIILVSFLAVMSFECVMDFYYIYIFLSIVVCLPDFNKMKEAGTFSSPCYWR